ncbi:hypothetical protein [Streptomyces sp. NPDC054765]
MTAHAPHEPTLGVLYDLLGVERDAPLADAVHASRALRGGFANIVLSAAETEGIPLTPGHAEELHRARRRAAGYRQLGRELSAMRGVTVHKGPSLARHYPEGWLRPSGDLDVVTEDEDTLWQVIGSVARRFPVEDPMLSLLQHGDERHLYVSVGWPAADPQFTPNFRVEVTTFAYGGEPGVVPMRPAQPADQWLADLLAIAEERFQREFDPKDLLDLTCALSTPTAPAPGPVAAAAKAYLLAPELLELCELAQRHAALASGLLRQLAELLRPAAQRESARRADGPGLPHVEDELGARRAAGLPLYGMQLAEQLRLGDLRQAVEHHVEADVLLRTPIADFLLVPAELVDPERYEAARTELATLAPWPASAADTD